MEGHQAASGPRRAEVLAALSLGIDLGLGLPMEHLLRAALLADALARRLGLDEARRATVYYTSLVLWIGCHADSHELSREFGDDIDFRARSYQVDWSGLPYLRLLVASAGRGRPPAERGRMMLAMLLAPRARLARLIHSHCLSAGLLAEQIGLGGEVGRCVRSAFERWDGGGLPAGSGGADIPLETRIVQLADVVDVHLRAGGVSGALAVARARSGRQFDPELVQLVHACAPEVLGGLPRVGVWDAALQRAPDRDVLLAGEALDAVLASMGDFVDMKCPFTAGHSRNVAALAADAAGVLGLDPADAGRLRRAGYVHDLGRLGVPNSVWEKPGPLTEPEWERVRLHPYLTGRILRRVPGLAGECAIAEAHHERQDGSGYPRGVSGAALGTPARLLAAADAYRTATEARPYRAALDQTAAAARLREEARVGRLDPAAVDAVLQAAGQRAARRKPWPAGLTGREVEVLRLLARGGSVRDIAAALSISQTTVRHHVEHVYTKLGVSNRTGAALFAARQGLLGTAEGAAGGSERWGSRPMR